MRTVSHRVDYGATPVECDPLDAVTNSEQILATKPSGSMVLLLSLKRRADRQIGGKQMNRAPECSDKCGLAHVLRNKLAIIVGTCELLSQHATDPETVVRLRNIKEAAEAMADAIDKPMSRSQGA